MGRWHFACGQRRSACTLCLQVRFQNEEYKLCHFIFLFFYVSEIPRFLPARVRVSGRAVSLPTKSTGQDYQVNFILVSDSCITPFPIQVFSCEKINCFMDYFYYISIFSLIWFLIGILFLILFLSNIFIANSVCIFIFLKLLIRISWEIVLRTCIGPFFMPFRLFRIFLFLSFFWRHAC